MQMQHVEAEPLRGGPLTEDGTPMAPQQRYTPEELATRINREISQSLGGPDTEIANARLRNLQFYRAAAVGELAPPVTPDRSQVVATDVPDTVEWMLPSLVRVFAQSKDALSCTARRPKYAPAAKMAAEYLRHHFWKRNGGFMVLYEWFKVALVQKVGFVKVYWDDKTEDSEEAYQGLLPTQVEEIAAEEGVTVLAASARTIRVELEAPGGEPGGPAASGQQVPPQSGPGPAGQMPPAGAPPGAPQMPPGQPAPPQQGMQPAPGRQGPQPAGPQTPEEQTVEVTVYDITIQRTVKTGRCVVETVPPEYMRVHRRARYGKAPPFIAEVRPAFKYELEEEGFDLTGVGEGLPWSSAEETERQSIQGGNNVGENGTDEFTLYERADVFMMLDQDMDGVAEWRHVVMVGDKVMSDEKVDDHPYVELCPNPEPHIFFGQCPADFAIEPQRLNTSLLRGLMDNVYLSVNQRTQVIEGQVNLDDLTNSRPGGVVRVKRLDAMAPILQSPLDAGAWKMVEWGEQWRERRTGFTRYSQGMSPDALNPTATGVGIITEKADQRVELIARVAAVSVERMFRKMLKCMGRYQSMPELVELMGQWLQVDPREWAEGYEIELDVGLGTGSKDKKAIALQQVNGMQQPLVQGGVINPQAAIESGRAFAEAIGLGEPEKYFPDAKPPQPPQPPPQIQAKQMELQADAQRFQVETQNEQQKAQAAAAEADRQRQHERQMALDKHRADVQRELLSLAAGVISARSGVIGPNVVNGTMLDQTGPAVAGADPRQLDEVIAQINRVAGAFSQQQGGLV